MIVRVRNLRVAVILIRDAVAVIIRIRDVRVTVTIGVQLEVSVRLIGAAIRVSHRNRNIELLNGVLVQLRLIRERNGDLTSGLVDLNDVTLRSLEVFRNLELRTFRSLRVLTVLVSEGRRRLRFLTRNNQLALIRRLELVALLGLVNDLDRCVDDLGSAIFVGDLNRNVVRTWLNVGTRLDGQRAISVYGDPVLRSDIFRKAGLLELRSVLDVLRGCRSELSGVRNSGAVLVDRALSRGLFANLDLGLLVFRSDVGQEGVSHESRALIGRVVNGSGVQGVLSKVFRNREITRRDDTEVVGVRLATVNFLTLTVSPNDHVSSVRDQTESLGFHLVTRSSRLVRGVVLQNIETA